MPSIHLLGPSVRNNGAYVDAGADLEIGDKPDQIDADRAAALTTARRAVAVTSSASRRAPTPEPATQPEEPAA